MVSKRIVEIVRSDLGEMTDAFEKICQCENGCGRAAHLATGTPAWHDRWPTYVLRAACGISGVVSGIWMSVPNEVIGEGSFVGARWA